MMPYSVQGYTITVIPSRNVFRNLVNIAPYGVQGLRGSIWVLDRIQVGQVQGTITPAHKVSTLPPHPCTTRCVPGCLRVYRDPEHQIPRLWH